jgi:hypothetical protein
LEIQTLHNDAFDVEQDGVMEDPSWTFRCMSDARERRRSRRNPRDPDRR